MNADRIAHPSKCPHGRQTKPSGAKKAWRWGANALACLVAAWVNGCYASAGPTIWYRIGEKALFGAEISSGYSFVHGNVGLFARDVSDDTPGGHLAPTFYGTAGLGVYYPLAKQPGFAGVFTGGVGAAYDRENKLMSLARLSGGPSFPSWDSGTDLTVLDLPLNRLTVNIFISMDYLNEEVWFHLSPQVGLASMPTSK